MLDVRAFHFGISEIKDNHHPVEGRRPETLKAQRRILKKWLANREVLHARVRMQEELVAARQLEQIAALVDTAFATHPFYHNLYWKAGYRSGDIVSWSDYEALPTITKNDIIEHFSEFTSHRVLSPAECYTSRTSGSSGRILTVLQDDTTTDQGILFYLRHYEQMLGRQRRPDEWLYEIYLAPPRYTSLDGSFPVFTLSQDCPPDAALEHLRLLKPTVLTAFPSYLRRMIELPGDFSEIGVAAICTNSETSTTGERALIAERFGAPVFDEYSSEELYLVATECRHGRYHLVEDNVRVDVYQPDESGLGEIVATSLVNTYMPFIRYRQGDIIRLSAHRTQCSCGSRFRPLDKFFGRADQFMLMRDGALVPPDRLMGLYDRTLILSESKIAEFELVQMSTNRIDLFVVPLQGHAAPDQAIIESFSSGLRELFDDPTLDVCTKVVAAISDNPSCKRRLVTSHVTRNGVRPSGQGTRYSEI